MSWFAKKPKQTNEAYLKAGTAAVLHLLKRVGLGQPLDGRTYSPEESKAVLDFQNDFVTWGIQQAPPLFALNADGKILCIPELSMSSLQGYITSTALQKLCRSEAYIHKDAQERLTTALRAWLSHMDSGVLRDMIPMLQELGWKDEVDQVSQILHRFPPYDSNDRFLSLCKSLLAFEKDPPPGLNSL